MKPLLRVLGEPFALLWRHRSLLIATVWSDVRARYAGSALGFAWMLFYPLLFLAAYALVYLYVFKVRFGLSDDETGGGVLLIFCGLIPFLGFAEALGIGVPSVTGNVHLVKNTLFPIELIPVKAVLAAQCTQLAGLGILLVALAALGRLTPWALCLPLVWALQLLFMLGVIWVLAASNVLLRDLQQAVAVVTLLLMLVSPIAYEPSMVPERLRSLLVFNPLHWLIAAYRDSLFHGRAPQGLTLPILSVLSVGSFCFGLWYFRRLKAVFVDNV